MRVDGAFPVREQDLPLLAENLAAKLRTKLAAIAYPGGEKVVELKTDSPHLYKMFSKNWKGVDGPARPNVKIVALREKVENYGFPVVMNQRRSYCRRSNTILYFDRENYANLKISIRGLLSQDLSENLMWIHGCTLKIRTVEGPIGILLLGRSGAGKTTLTATLKRRFANSLLLTNDDWGAVSLQSRRTCHTGERMLHMKYLSVTTLRPDLKVGPQSHLSEHYSGNRADPVARLLISPYEVFGSDGLARENEIDLIVILRRQEGIAPGLRVLERGARSIVEAGEYSEYYEGIERFMNGSLILTSADDLARHRADYDGLFARMPAVELANVESPEVVTDHLVKHLHEIGTKFEQGTRVVSSR